MSLSKKVALVAGASRGLGKGIALGFGEAGATVYVTARGKKAGWAGSLGSIWETAREVDSRGGRGVPVICDHSVESSVVSLFRKIWEEEGCLDILVNAVYPDFTFKRNYPSSLSGRTPLNVAFWDLPLAYWDELQIRSLRACYLTLWYAAPYFVRQGSGLIAVLSSQGAVEYSFNVPYGVDKAGIEKIVADAARDLAAFNVTTIAIRPPLTKTEMVAAAVRREGLEISKSRSPVYTGRVLAALAADPDIIARSGSAYEVIELAKLYGIADDIDNE